jgi:small ligand-binding sensory domain FIST
MLFRSAVDDKPELAPALQTALDIINADIPADEVGLLIAFVAGYSAHEVDAIVPRLAENLPAATIVGCTAAGTINDGVEYEQHPTVSLLAGNLPGSTSRRSPWMPGCPATCRSFRRRSCTATVA